MAQENNGDSRATNKIGVYTHKESGEKLQITDPIQGDAAVRIGFTRTGDLPSREERQDNTEAIREAEANDAKARLEQHDAAAAKAREQAIAEQNARSAAGAKAVTSTEGNSGTTAKKSTTKKAPAKK